ncbi:MAG: hypothetical protein HYX27_02595 [Acidobacteria bacterium]|nr:hypothetical protein [Acidobacteriota bacterium]
MQLFSQPARIGGAGQKAFLQAPVVGSGSWEDPKRPAFVKESGVPFRFQLSDDGKMAIVEVTPRNLAEMAKLESLAKNEPRARIFHPGRDKQSDVIAAFKALKKDFDPATFTRPGPPDSVPGK